MNNFKKLTVYQKSFSLAMDIFEITKKFPKEEQYALTSQIRRSSRAICSNLGEAYRKRQYEAHFVSKVSDSDMENSETQIWIDFAFSCQYIDETLKNKLEQQSDEIGRLLFHMIKNPDKYKSKS
ncbi:MAG: four helix bundle protein [Cytophagaceae bacterium]|nr:four helix bundle protein [Cytophagaceae bacterium]